MKLSKNFKILLVLLVVTIVGSGIYLSTAATQPSKISFNGQTDSVATIVSDTLKSKSDTIVEKSEVLKDSTKVDTSFVYFQTGEASWYGLGDGYHGKRTASGVTFDTYTNMCAHKTLPFGTLLRVTNLKNGLSTIVKVVDRGPFVRGRIIDLSYHSKKEIGMDGVAKVKLEKILINGSSVKNTEETKVVHKKKSKRKKG